MSKTIQFSAEEITELRSFYSNELATAEERIKHIRAILAKIGNTSNGRGRKPMANNADADTSILSAPAKKKRGRPALKTKKVVDGVNATPKRRGRPAKAKPAESSAAPIVGGKKRGRKPKLQTPQSNAALATPVESNTSAPQAKKRGRKPSSVAKKTNSNKVIKAKVAGKSTGIKRGRKPGTKLTKPASTSQTQAKAVINPKDKKVKIAAKASGAKRGRKSSKVSTPAEAKTAVVSKTAKTKTVNVTSTSPAAVIPKPKIVKPAPAKTKSTAAKTAKAPKAPKAVLAKAKVVKAGPAKVVSVKKAASKETKSQTPSANKAKKPKIESAPKKASKKELYQELIFKTFASEPRFYTTEEIVNAGIKEFKLQGKEKDAAKNTMQFILNGLQSQSKILRRRKEKDRQAYWASLGTNDEGYLK